MLPGIHWLFSLDEAHTLPSHYTLIVLVQLMIATLVGGGRIHPLQIE